MAASGTEPDNHSREQAGGEQGYRLRGAHVVDERRARAQATNASDPLDPAFEQRDNESGSVHMRYNETKSSPEEIACDHGEPVELFGDNTPGIDGTVGELPRPLQLKAKPDTLDAVFDSAVTACEKARAQGYGDDGRYVPLPNAPCVPVPATRPRTGDDQSTQP